MEAGITKSYYYKVSRVKNDAGFNAIEEGITKVIIAAYTVMKITLVSQQSKLDELMSLSTHVSIDENNASIIAVEAG